MVQTTLMVSFFSSQLANMLTTVTVLAHTKQSALNLWTISDTESWQHVHASIHC